MPITLPNFSANQPVKGLVSDLSTALEAYMDQKERDTKNRGQEYENMYTKAKGERAEDYVASEIQRNENLALMEALKVAKETQYGGKREELEQKKIQADINYINSGKGGKGKRTYLSNVGKLNEELSDVNAGYLPGSDREVPISPEEQERLRGQYELQIQKSGTDAGTRERALFAKNLRKTMDSVNVDDYVQYSGPGGTSKLIKDKALDVIGKAPERYLRYKEAETALDLEAKELRQFLKDSISPRMQEKLNKVLKVNSSFKDPETAKRQINTFRKTIGKQLDTYTGALKNTKQYEGRESESGDYENRGTYKNVTHGHNQDGTSDYTDDDLYRIIRGQ